MFSPGLVLGAIFVTILSWENEIHNEEQNGEALFSAQSLTHSDLVVVENKLQG
jgi:hypothetical protein